MIDTDRHAKDPDKIMTTAVNNIRSIALIEDGLDIESLLPLWRIPDRDSGDHVPSRVDRGRGLHRIERHAPPLDCLTRTLRLPSGPAPRTRR